MKIKHSLLLIGLGYCIDILGSVSKIMHQPGADFTLTIGAAIKIIGILLLLYKLLTHPKAKDFLNW
jgi:hypothetical protein